jgi:hypothetical protein
MKIINLNLIIMKIITSKITQYWVHFQAGRIENNLIHPRTIIKCYHDNVYVLQLSFYPDKKNLPENYYDINSKLVYLRYSMSMYSYILDILRNEKPIYFSYSETSKLGFLRTGKEPVGEGEIEQIELEEATDL